MPNAKAVMKRAAVSCKSPQAAKRQQPEIVSWREGLQGLVTMIGRRDFDALRRFCPQLASNPDIAMSLHGMLLVARDGDVQNWDGIPEDLVSLTAIVADHLEAMDEALDEDDIGDPDVDAGAWIQVGLTPEGRTRVTLGWFDLDDDPVATEYHVHQTIDFGTSEAVLAFLLIAEMADFAVYTGHEAALN